MTPKENYRATAITLITHVVVLSVGFIILTMVFDFPDVLRKSAEYRLTLFAENSRIVVPVYYLLALTGLTQVALSVLLYQSFEEGRDGLLLLATTFGVLTGVFQVLGFIRWPIVVPYFADAMNSNVPMETIAFVEGTLNRYAGMAIGEHLGFLCQAVWTTLLGARMLRYRLFNRSLGWVGLVIGLLSFPMSMEPLGGFLTVFGELTWPLMAAWLIWLILLAISLLRTDEETQIGIAMGWRTATVSAIVWAVMVVPAYMG